MLPVYIPRSSTARIQRVENGGLRTRPVHRIKTVDCSLSAHTSSRMVFLAHASKTPSDAKSEHQDLVHCVPDRDIQFVISSNVTELKTLLWVAVLRTIFTFLKLVLRQVWKKTELQDASKNRTRSVYCTNTVDCSISARVGMCFWRFDSMLQNTILLEIWALRLSGLNPWQNGLNQQYLVFMLSNLQINFWNRDIRLVISSNVTKLKTFFSNHLKNDCIFLKLVLLQVWENRGTRH